MVVLYYLAVKAYGILILSISLFNSKAGQWVNGRKNWKRKIADSLHPNERRILFHCPSLGEFEQGKPVLEALRKELPNHKIILTFFSPSGYEIRKNEPLADYVFYLPLDGPLNSKAFINLTAPEMVFFVKYDFWHFMIKACKDNKIPVFFVSSIFRPSQIFFHWYGSFFNTMLRRVTHFFVQNQSSLELLYRNSIPQVTVTGDTRFDRVYQNSLHAKDLPEISALKGSGKLFVAGSTWPADDTLLENLVHEYSHIYKFVIVPHETGTAAIRKTTAKFTDAVLYSQWDKKTPVKVLIIDHVGILSALYHYADVAYVGGGFGKGIHNILEAAVFGIPVIFGPNYKKFREANELIRWKGAFSIRNYKELSLLISGLSLDEAQIARIREVNLKYINNNKGATDLIINYLRMNHSL
jgi:3-deoxy-D-manno-octulosonic-acid transferase